MTEPDAHCKDILDFLSDYLEKELDDATVARFETHLAKCPYCRDYIMTFRDTMQLTRGLNEAEACETVDQLPEELIRAILKSRDA